MPTDVKLTRREVLLVGTTLTALGCPAPTSGADAGPSIDPQAFDHSTTVSLAPEAIALSLTIFPQTVSAGAMLANSVMLWTRAVGLGQLTLKVWREAASSSEVALVHDEVVTVPDHGNVKVTVGSLAPATWYHYAFFSADLTARSPIGKVRTAFPDDWKEPLTVGATCCASYRYRPFKPLEAIARQNVDLCLYLGDQSYNDGAGSLPTFRQKWQEQLADPGYRALLPATGSYLVWDDHEFENNFDPEALGPNDPIITGGKQSFFETFPVEETNGRIWRSYRWGQTAEFFALDCRTERKPSTKDTAQAQFISPEQLAWLQQALTASPCHFKVILTSVPISIMPPPSWGGQSDRWQGYAAQRETFLSWLEASGLSNVWFLSGDLHLGLVMRIERSGSRSKYLETCVGPAGNVNPLSLVLEPGQEANKKIAFPPDQFLYAGGTFQATTFTFDPRANTVRIKFIDPAKDDAVTYDQTLTFGVS